MNLLSKTVLLSIVWLSSSAFMVYSGFNEYGSSSNAKPVVEKYTNGTSDFLSKLYQTKLSNSEDKRRVYSGQLISSKMKHIKSDYDKNVISLKEDTGETPFILGLDYGRASEKEIMKANTYLIRHSNAGGVAAISFSLMNPWVNRSKSYIGYGKYKFDDIFKAGTEPNIRFQEDLRRVKNGLLNLKISGVTVLLSPYPEMNGDEYWWSNLSRDQYIKLWECTFDYFHKAGLNNVLWVYSPLSKDFNKDIKYYYPGSSRVDVVSISSYGDVIDLGVSYDAALKLDKPVALSIVAPSKSFSKSNKLNNIETVKAMKKYSKIGYFYYGEGWVKKPIVNNKNSYSLMHSNMIINL